ncbi:MAG: cytochrome c oxidase accessory protein CcoG [Lautropia sp.]
MGTEASSDADQARPAARSGKAGPRRIIPISAADDHGSADEDGGWLSNYVAHRKVYPRAVTGRYARLRIAVVLLTQLVFYGLPWLQWNGRQAVLFDLGARKFHLFGLVLWPQDFIYLAGLLIISALGLFFVTALAGRVWCGYACPQTVYTEVFLWIERWFEGDRVRRLRLDAAPMSLSKLARKTGKHGVWIALSLWTGFTFIGYFAPIRELGGQLATLSLGPWQWFWWLFYAFATWGNAGFLREQVCTYMCPYARFQGAMFDNDTMIVTYDQGRGDPRGSRPRRVDPASRGLGDCVDCTLCVQVCPTGIDIREGLQYQCIGCAACVDVCNGVMDRMGYARGLIRYTTGNALAQRLAPAAIARRALRPRVLIYGALLAALTVGLASSLALRNPLRADVIRDRNALGRPLADGGIENTYRLQLMNASERPLRVRVSASGNGIVVAGPAEYQVPAASNRAVALNLQLPAEARLPPGAHPVRLHIEATELADADAPADTAPRTLRPIEETATFLIPR